MAMANRAAASTEGYLSLGHSVDFSQTHYKRFVSNPDLQGLMVYPYEELLARQADFKLDFPIIVQGGIGTDYEFNLELAVRKGQHNPTPILLFGDPQHWGNKLTSTYQENLASGTIEQAKWIGNTVICVTTAEEALEVYRQYAAGTLEIGPEHPGYDKGFRVFQVR